MDHLQTDTPGIPETPESGAALPARVLAAPDRAQWLHWGLRDYGEVLAMQESLRERRREYSIPDTWLAGEHHPVITLGARGDEKSDVIAPPSGGLPVYRIDRGGQTTLHNPGQLVIYPIVKTQPGLLAQARLSRALLETVRDWIARREGIVLEFPRGRPGLFFEGRKIAAIGVSIRRQTSMHGIAINLCNDLAPWKMIVACGEPDTRPATLSEVLGRRISPADMLADFEGWLREGWGYEKAERVDQIPNSNQPGRDRGGDE